VVHPEALGGSPHRASARDGKKTANVNPRSLEAIDKLRATCGYRRDRRELFAEQSNCKWKAALRRNKHRACLLTVDQEPAFEFFEIAARNYRKFEGIVWLP
jgi:hypothetical protein